MLIYNTDSFGLKLYMVKYYSILYSRDNYTCSVCSRCTCSSHYWITGTLYFQTCYVYISRVFLFAFANIIVMLRAYVDILFSYDVI